LARRGRQGCKGKAPWTRRRSEKAVMPRGIDGPASRVERQNVSSHGLRLVANGLLKPIVDKARLLWWNCMGVVAWFTGIHLVSALKAPWY
jgi:hypothetical protein